MLETKLFMILLIQQIAARMKCGMVIKLGWIGFY